MDGGYMENIDEFAFGRADSYLKQVVYRVLVEDGERLFGIRVKYNKDEKVEGDELTFRYALCNLIVNLLKTDRKAVMAVLYKVSIEKINICGELKAACGNKDRYNDRLDAEMEARMKLTEVDEHWGKEWLYR